MKKLLISLLLPILFGCSAHNVALHENMTTSDGILNSYPSDIDLLASNTVNTLSKYYAPAKTSFYVIKVNGSFGDVLISKMHSVGYAVMEFDKNSKKISKDAILIAYVVDEVQNADRPAIFVNIQLSDGQCFSIMHYPQLTEIPKLRPLNNTGVVPLGE